MDKKIVLIAFIGLITVNQSCTNKMGGQQPQSTDFDSVAADSTAELDSLSPYWYDKNQTEVIFSDKKDTLYRFPREKMGGIYSIPYTVKYIEERAFMGCKEIEEVYIPQSVEHIEMAAFENCQKLEYVYMLSPIDTIPFRCFNGCEKLEAIHLVSEKPPFVNEFGLDNINLDNCVLYVPQGSSKKYKQSEVWKGFKHIEEELLYLSIYKKTASRNYRDFFITKGENGFLFMAYDSRGDEYHHIQFNADDYLNDGVPGMCGFVSPDGRFVYVVGDILPNSTGWVSRYIIYQVDTNTLKAKFLNGVAGIRLDKEGFTVSSMTRCTTPDAECSADMDFAFQDITYGFDGKVMRKSKEYASNEIEKKYGEELCNIKGLGVCKVSSK